MTSAPAASAPYRRWRACSATGSAVHDDVTTLAGFQDVVARTFGDRDRERGVAATVAWLTEELGELAQAVRKGDDDARLHELGDVLAWLASLADQLGLSLEDAARRYAAGCPRCTSIPCACPS